MSETETVLDARDVVAGYGKIVVLDGMSLRVSEREAVALLGPNGAGKSTFLAAVSGLIGTRSGRVEFHGEDVTDLAAHKRVRRGLVQVPEARRIFPDLAVEDNLLLGAYPYERRPERLEKEFEEVYDLFPVLSDRRALHAATLSGGEAQMLALGMALMARPRLLMLDEPSLGLAPILVDEMFEAIAELRDAGTTILLVEQLSDQALDICDRAYVLSIGAVTAEGRSDEIRGSEALRKAYLG